LRPSNGLSNHSIGESYLQFITVSAVFTLVPCVVFGAQLASGPLTLSPGGSGVVVFSYSSAGDQVSGLQFDLTFSADALNLVTIPGPAVRYGGKSFYTAIPGAGSSRVLIAGLNQNLLSDGPLVTVFVNVAPNAATGAYTIGMVNAFAADSAGNAVAITDASVALTISGEPGSGAAIQSTGILNAASWISSPVSAGEVVALIGAGIGPAQPATLQFLPSGLVSTDLSNTIVSFDSTQAPLIYAGQNQINAVVPFEVSGQASTVLTIIQSGQSIGSITVPVAAAAPALFTQSATGVGPVAALNQDGSLNAPLNPAAEGSVVTVYLTGTGQTNPPGVTGAITSTSGSNLLSTTAMIAGLPADILYAGPAPGVIAGVSQVNLRVPAGANSSLTAPISVVIGGVPTQTGVTLSVR
jgi:uncharacterized protein (TIGR03437 family)